MRTTLVRLLPALAVTAALIGAPPAGATSTPQQVSAAVKAGASYLEAQQQPSGLFESDWVLGALAASGQPASGVVPQGAGSRRPLGLPGARRRPTKWPGPEPRRPDYERAALNAYAAGIEPARVSKQNLIARILSFYEPAAPGVRRHRSLQGTVFGSLALAERRRGRRTARPAALLEQTVTMIEANQHTDGGWNYQKVEGNETVLESAAEPDETGAAMAALCGAGVAPTTNVNQGASLSEVRAGQPDGAFESEFKPNTDSNAWAVQGLNACKINPQEEGFTTKKKDADRLPDRPAAGRRRVHVRRRRTSANEYSSQDAVRALGGGTFTATPPKGKHGQFLYEKAFTPGTPSQLALVVSTPAALEVCAVTVDPAATKTTLGAVLEAAQAGSEPEGCVSGYEPTTGTGKLTTIDGTNATAGTPRRCSSTAAKQRPRSSPARWIGDTIYLALGRRKRVGERRAAPLPKRYAGLSQPTGGTIESVYRVTEVIGVSSDSWEAAAANAIAVAGNRCAICVLPRWCART